MWGIDNIHNVSIIPLFIGARRSTVPCSTKCRLLMIEAELRHKFVVVMTTLATPSESNAPHQHEDDNYDQDRAKHTHPAIAKTVAIAAEASAESAQKGDDKNDDQNRAK